MNKRKDVIDGIEVTSEDTKEQVGFGFLIAGGNFDKDGKPQVERVNSLGAGLPASVVEMLANDHDLPDFFRNAMRALQKQQERVAAEKN